MRIELQDENKEEPAEVKEPTLKDKHESDLTKKEKRELEKMKLGEMSFTGKLGYIWAYYKAHIFTVLGLILVLFIAWDAYQNSLIKEALSITVLNSTGANVEEAQEKIKEMLGVSGDKYKKITLEENLFTINDGKELDPYGQMAFVTKIQASAIDMVVVPESFYREMDEDMYFMDMKELLGEELYASFGENIDEHHITFSNEKLGELFDIAYEPVCVGVLGNAANKENAVKLIKALAD